MTRLFGMLAAAVTPLTSDDRVDERATRRLVDALIEAGVHGLVPTGSTGEFSSLTADERRRVVEIAMDAAAGRVPVIPHTAAIATRDAVALSRHAQQSGAAAIMLVPPYYEPLSEEEVRAHYAAVAAAVDLPIVIYNIPSCSGFAFRPDFVLRLADEIPTIRYVKDTTGDARALQEMLAAFGDRIGVFNGWDTLSLLGLVAGAVGCIWGAVNVMPRECVALYELVVEKKDLVGARELWSRMWPANAFFEREGYVGAIKAGAALAGRPAGDPRPPLKRLGPGKVEELRRLLVPLGIVAPAR